ncbi:MAG: segregation/condensation protein A, partial [Lachnospiraceae bacterium]|nr:segregation/condensation protein A [Lachnospiraceae bacterium]
MEISYKLESFEGPLDLLLHLIEKNKVNIYDIPIAMITDQYLEYVKHMEEESLDVVSEFLVMAATLLDIKARMLLPKEVNEEGEEEDPRAELVERLLEYKTYKYMSLELKDMELDAEKIFYKSPTIPKEVEKYEQP